MKKLTEAQGHWLISRGGRTKADVVEIKGKLSVLMVEGRDKFKVVPIPEDDFITLKIDKNGLVQDTSQSLGKRKSRKVMHN